jgi:hypothetical protein
MRRSIAARVHLVSLALAAVLLAGCPHYYGGRTQASFESSQPVTIYLVPLFDWDQHGKESMLNDPSALRSFRKGVATTTQAVSEGTHILVTECDGRRTWREVTVRIGDSNTFAVSCP